MLKRMGFANTSFEVSRVEMEHKYSVALELRRCTHIYQKSR